MADTRTQQPLDGEADDPNAMLTTQQLKPTPLAGAPATTPPAVQPTTTSPLPLSTAQPIQPVSATDPLAFAGSPAPTAAPAPTPAAGYGGSGSLGALSYADAVQQAYRDQQARMAETGVEEAPIDYSQAGLNDAGLWGQSQADVAANAARRDSIINDPSSTAGAKSLASLPGYGTPEFDRAINNGSNPDLAAQVQQLLGESAAQHVPTPAPTGEDYLVGGEHFNNFADAQAAEQTPAGAGSSGAPTRSLVPGRANDAGGGGLAPLLSALGVSSPASGAPGATGAVTPSANGGGGGGGGSGGTGVQLTPTDPNNALTGQTITPGAGIDRFKIARDQLAASRDASEPGYQADLREANRQAFGAGRGVSGMLRTTRGNIESDRETGLRKQESDLLNGALTGSIDDLYKNLGIAQQQQGFQADQQQRAFGNEVTRQQLEDALINSDFGRNLSREQAGYANDPSNIALILSQIFGQGATGASQAAAGAFQQAGHGSSSDPTLAYLLSLLGGGGAGGGAVDTSGGTAGYPGNP